MTDPRRLPPLERFQNEDEIREWPRPRSDPPVPLAHPDRTPLDDDEDRRWL